MQLGVINSSILRVFNGQNLVGGNYLLGCVWSLASPARRKENKHLFLNKQANFSYFLDNTCLFKRIYSACLRRFFIPDINLNI
jgi:hypothetical protein